VLRDILENVERMVQGEIRLAKMELLEEVRGAAGAAQVLMIGAVIAALALAFLLLCAFLLLETTVAPWLAALIVAAGAAGVASLALNIGLKKMQRPRQPRPGALVSRMERTV
jgi:uncharacterized membrane protein YqjE